MSQGDHVRWMRHRHVNVAWTIIPVNELLHRYVGDIVSMMENISIEKIDLYIIVIADTIP